MKCNKFADNLKEGALHDVGEIEKIEKYGKKSSLHV
jgi:hypothetical protein